MSIILLPLLTLALLQGILEFLPVSSEGQLLLAAVNLFGIDAPTALSIAFWLHLGTAITVILFYRKDVFSPIYSRFHSSETDEEASSGDRARLFGPLFVFVFMGTLGTVVVALPLYFLLRALVSQVMGETVSAFVGGLLLITGIVLYFQRRGHGMRELGNISMTESFVLGLVQGFAVLPGISRSGMTLTWLLLRGMKREEALRLSFLLGVPASFGIIALDFLLGNVYWAEPWVLLLMTIVALMTGLIALWGLRYTATRIPYWAFCLILGSLVLVLTIPTIITLFSLQP